MITGLLLWYVLDCVQILWVAGFATISQLVNECPSHTESVLYVIKLWRVAASYLRKIEGKHIGMIVILASIDDVDRLVMCLYEQQLIYDN